MRTLISSLVFSRRRGKHRPDVLYPYRCCLSCHGFFNRLSWFSKTKNALDECSETDDQHANASNHGLQISGLLDWIHIAERAHARFKLSI